MEKLFLDHPWIIILILLWIFPWKGAALWRAARRGHLGWFLTLLILNTFAILDILYIFVFSSWGNGKQKEENKDEQQKADQNQPPQTRPAQFSMSSKNRTTIL